MGGMVKFGKGNFYRLRVLLAERHICKLSAPNTVEFLTKEGVISKKSGECIMAPIPIYSLC
jgi:hypothetical protein